MNPLILVIDDEEAIRLFLDATLEDEGYDVVAAGTGQEALDALTRTVPDLVILDLMLPDMSGIEVLGAIKQKLPHLPVVMVTAYSETDSAVQAMKLDAFDYVSKPIQLDRLLSVVARGLEESAPARERYRQQHQSDLFDGSDGIVPSQSPPMLELYDTIRKISGGSSTTVLIEGESGVGKDVVATLIHRTSPRKDYPFLEINCAALPEQLLESELFGHEKGAFTDAATQKMGLLELTHSGTLFLDEVGEMALPIQVKLLRVLEKMTFRRVGGLEDISVNVRIIAATNRNLATQVRKGTFREDLYYRLKVVQLRVPPLRSRLEDIMPLAEFFLAHYNQQFGKGFNAISDAARKRFMEYRWPGNIRELKNLMERTVLLEDGQTLEATHLSSMIEDHSSHDMPARLQEILLNPLPAGGIKLEELVSELESVLVRKAYLAADQNQSKAARLLGLNRDKFRYRMKQHGIKE